jgi:DNA-binding transcriptional ArsR family regulator
MRQYMTDDTFELKAQLLSVMANAQRLRMLAALSRDEIPVGRLAEMLDLSQSALSQHLAKLRSMGLVNTGRDAQSVYYSVSSTKVQAVLDLLSGLFDEQAMPQARLVG